MEIEADPVPVETLIPSVGEVFAGVGESIGQPAVSFSSVCSISESNSQIVFGDFLPDINKPPGSQELSQDGKNKKLFENISRITYPDGSIVMDLSIVDVKNIGDRVKVKLASLGLSGVLLNIEATGTNCEISSIANIAFLQKLTQADPSKPVDEILREASDFAKQAVDLYLPRAINNYKADPNKPELNMAVAFIKKDGSIVAFSNNEDQELISVNEQGLVEDHATVNPDSNGIQQISADKAKGKFFIGGKGTVAKLKAQPKSGSDSGLKSKGVKEIGNILTKKEAVRGPNKLVVKSAQAARSPKKDLDNGPESEDRIVLNGNWAGVIDGAGGMASGSQAAQRLLKIASAISTGGDYKFLGSDKSTHLVSGAKGSFNFDSKSRKANEGTLGGVMIHLNRELRALNEEISAESGACIALGNIYVDDQGRRTLTYLNYGDSEIVIVGKDGTVRVVENHSVRELSDKRGDIELYLSEREAAAKLIEGQDTGKLNKEKKDIIGSVDLNDGDRVVFLTDGVAEDLHNIRGTINPDGTVIPQRNAEGKAIGLDVLATIDPNIPIDQLPQAIFNKLDEIRVKTRTSGTTITRTSKTYRGAQMRRKAVDMPSGDGRSQLHIIVGGKGDTTDRGYDDGESVVVMEASSIADTKSKPGITAGGAEVKKVDVVAQPRVVTFPALGQASSARPAPSPGARAPSQSPDLTPAGNTPDATRVTVDSTTSSERRRRVHQLPYYADIKNGEGLPLEGIESRLIRTMKVQGTDGATTDRTINYMSEVDRLVQGRSGGQTVDATASIATLDELEKRVRFSGDYRGANDPIFDQTRNLPHQDVLLMAIEAKRARIMQAENKLKKDAYNALHGAETSGYQRRKIRTAVMHDSIMVEVGDPLQTYMEGKVPRAEQRRDMLSFTYIADQLMDIPDPRLGVDATTGRPKNYRQVFGELLSRTDERAGQELLELRRIFYRNSIDALKKYQAPVSSREPLTAEESIIREMQTRIQVMAGEFSMASDDVNRDAIAQKYKGVSRATDASQSGWRDKNKAEFANLLKNGTPADVLDGALKGAEMMYRRSLLDKPDLDLYDVPSVIYHKEKKEFYDSLHEAAGVEEVDRTHRARTVAPVVVTHADLTPLVETASSVVAPVPVESRGGVASSSVEIPTAPVAPVAEATPARVEPQTPAPAPPIEPVPTPEGFPTALVLGAAVTDQMQSQITANARHLRAEEPVPPRPDVRPGKWNFVKRNVGRGFKTVLIPVWVPLYALRHPKNSAKFVGKTFNFIEHKLNQAWQNRFLREAFNARDMRFSANISAKSKEVLGLAPSVVLDLDQNFIQLVEKKGKEAYKSKPAYKRFFPYFVKLFSSTTSIGATPEMREARKWLETPEAKVELKSRLGKSIEEQNELAARFVTGLESTSTLTNDDVARGNEDLLSSTKGEKRQLIDMPDNIQRGIKRGIVDYINADKSNPENTMLAKQNLIQSVNQILRNRIDADASYWLLAGKNTNGEIVSNIISLAEKVASEPRYLERVPGSSDTRLDQMPIKFVFGSARWNQARQVEDHGLWGKSWNETFASRLAERVTRNKGRGQYSALYSAWDITKEGTMYLGAYALGASNIAQTYLPKIGIAYLNQYAKTHLGIDLSINQATVWGSAATGVVSYFRERGLIFPRIGLPIFDVGPSVDTAVGRGGDIRGITGGSVIEEFTQYSHERGQGRMDPDKVAAPIRAEFEQATVQAIDAQVWINKVQEIMELADTDLTTQKKDELISLLVDAKARMNLTDITSARRDGNIKKTFQVSVVQNFIQYQQGEENRQAREMRGLMLHVKARLSPDEVARLELSTKIQNLSLVREAQLRVGDEEVNLIVKLVKGERKRAGLPRLEDADIRSLHENLITSGLTKEAQESMKAKNRILMKYVRKRAMQHAVATAGLSLVFGELAHLKVGLFAGAEGALRVAEKVYEEPLHSLSESWQELASEWHEWGNIIQDPKTIPLHIVDGHVVSDLNIVQKAGLIARTAIHHLSGRGLQTDYHIAESFSGHEVSYNLPYGGHFIDHDGVRAVLNVRSGEVVDLTNLHFSQDGNGVVIMVDNQNNFVQTADQLFGVAHTTDTASLVTPAEIPGVQILAENPTQVDIHLNISGHELVTKVPEGANWTTPVPKDGNFVTSLVFDDESGHHKDLIKDVVFDVNGKIVAPGIGANGIETVMSNDLLEVKVHQNIISDPIQGAPIVEYNTPNPVELVTPTMIHHELWFIASDPRRNIEKSITRRSLIARRPERIVVPATATAPPDNGHHDPHPPAHPPANPPAQTVPPQNAHATSAAPAPSATQASVATPAPQNTAQANSTIPNGQNHEKPPDAVTEQAYLKDQFEKFKKSTGVHILSDIDYELTRVKQGRMTEAEFNSKRGNGLYAKIKNSTVDSVEDPQILPLVRREFVYRMAQISLVDRNIVTDEQINLWKGVHSFLFQNADDIYTITTAMEADKANAEAIWEAKTREHNLELSWDDYQDAANIFVLVKQEEQRLGQLMP